MQPLKVTEFTPVFRDFDIFESVLERFTIKQQFDVPPKSNPSDEESSLFTELSSMLDISPEELFKAVLQLPEPKLVLAQRLLFNEKLVKAVTYGFTQGSQTQSYIISRDALSNYIERPEISVADQSSIGLLASILNKIQDHGISHQDQKIFSRAIEGLTYNISAQGSKLSSAKQILSSLVSLVLSSRGAGYRPFLVNAYVALFVSLDGSQVPETQLLESLLSDESLAASPSCWMSLHRLLANQTRTNTLPVTDAFMETLLGQATHHANLMRSTDDGASPVPGLGWSAPHTSPAGLLAALARFCRMPSESTPADHGASPILLSLLQHTQHALRTLQAVRRPQSHPAAARLAGKHLHLLVAAVANAALQPTGHGVFAGEAGQQVLYTANELLLLFQKNCRDVDFTVVLVCAVGNLLYAAREEFASQSQLAEGLARVAKDYCQTIMKMGISDITPADVQVVALQYVWLLLGLESKGQTAKGCKEIGTKCSFFKEIGILLQDPDLDSEIQSAAYGVLMCGYGQVLVQERNAA